MATSNILHVSSAMSTNLSPIIEKKAPSRVIILLRSSQHVFEKVFLEDCIISLFFSFEIPLSAK